MVLIYLKNQAIVFVKLRIGYFYLTWNFHTLFVFFPPVRVANPKNVVYIAPKILSHLRGTVDEYLREDVIRKVAYLAETHAPSSVWWGPTTLVSSVVFIFTRFECRFHLHSF